MARSGAWRLALRTPELPSVSLPARATPLSAWKAQVIVIRLGAIHDLGSMDVSRGFGRD